MALLVILGFAGLVGYDAYLLSVGEPLSFMLKLATGVMATAALFAFRSLRLKANVSEMYNHYERTGQAKVPRYHD